jgi:hypothetical protein
MKHTEKNSMYVVDYEANESVIREYMSGADLEQLMSRENRGDVRITSMIRLNQSAK